VADSSGKIVRQIGKKGSGPGEFKNTDIVAELPSSYLIFDRSLRRVTELSKHEFAVRRITPMPGWSRLPYVVFSDGRYAFSTLLTEPSDVGYPIHLIGIDGNVSHSFGGYREIEKGLKSQVFERALSKSGEAALWAGHQRQYRVEKWDTAGNLLLVLERRASWFPLGDSLAWKFSYVRLDEQPLLSAMHEDQNGYLWVYIIAGNPGFNPPGQPGESPANDAIIEVLDPFSRKVLVTERIRNWIGGSVTGGFYQSSYRTSSSGEPLIDVWGFRVKR
jgi:hypothetical protein